MCHWPGVLALIDLPSIPEEHALGPEHHSPLQWQFLSQLPRYPDGRPNLSQIASQMPAHVPGLPKDGHDEDIENLLYRFGLNSYACYSAMPCNVTLLILYSALGRPRIAFTRSRNSMMTCLTRTVSHSTMLQVRFCLCYCPGVSLLLLLPELAHSAITSCGRCRSQSGSLRHRG